MPPSLMAAPLEVPVAFSAVLAAGSEPVASAALLEVLLPHAVMPMTIARDRTRAAPFLNFFIVGSSNHVL